MNKQPYDSLRERLVLPFVLLGFVVSALLSLVTFGSVAEFEERSIKRTLSVELESFRNRKAINPQALPPSVSVLFGRFLPDPEFPMLSPVKAGHDEFGRVLHNDRDYSVLLTDIDGAPYALIFDRSYVNSSLGWLALFLVGATLLMTLLSFFLSNHLAAQVVRPITRLLGEISDKTRSGAMQSGAQQGFSSTDYPRNEIGHLVQALDRYSARLSGFIERESYFAADVSHELRTPVAVISGAAEVLVDYPDLPEPVRQRLSRIHRHAVRMGQILEAMLLLAREEEGEGHDPACAVANVVEEVLADVQPSLEGRPIEIVGSLEARPILRVERSLAYVVISNLLRNACSHTQAGTIAVRLAAQSLEIVDSGMGIPEERFSELFKRHAKGEESTGHGLGLSIVARVAQRLGWTVDIRSTSGVGTQVTVTF